MAATKHLFVAKDVAYGAKIGGGTVSGFNEVNQLDNGAVGVFNPNGTLLTALNVATEMAAHKEYYIAVGSGDATKGAKVSIMIPKAPTSGLKAAYVAPVKQRSFIGQNSIGGGSLNLPTIAKGAIFSIRIIDANAPDTTTAKKWYYEVVATATDTNTSVITKLIAAINADTTRIADATVVGAQLGIQLDGLNYDQPFNITVSDNLSSADVFKDGDTVGNGSILVAFGNGRPSQLLTLEDETTTYEGRGVSALNTPQLFWSAQSWVDTAATYDMYDIVWDISKSLPYKVEGATTQYLYLAVKVGAAQQATLETLLAAVGVTI